MRSPGFKSFWLVGNANEMVVIILVIVEVDYLIIDFLFAARKRWGYTLLGRHRYLCTVSNA